MLRAVLRIAVLTVLLTPAATSAQAQTADARCLDKQTPDADVDGISDDCELELAQRFAPHLTFSRGTCNLVLPVPRPTGGYLFGVQRVDSTIRIAYLPAYVDDCGWDGPKCRIPGVDCRPHAGDSEFIVIELRRRSADSVDVAGIFLSAHCFGRTADDCRWYRAEDLEQFEWQAGAPVVWVAKGRNANYPSKRVCDRGHHFLDTCDEAMFRSAFPVQRGRNIGSQQRPAFEEGCVRASDVKLSTTSVECIWDPAARFKGWQPNAAGVTGYYRYLAEVAGFARGTRIRR